MKKIICTRTHLITPNGTEIVPTELERIDDANKGIFKIDITYNGVHYQGQGNTIDPEQAFADLQNNLPNDVKITCCVTCRYGNMCPYGNESNLIFCAKGRTFSNKLDVCDWFDETNAYDKNRVSICGYCDDFVFSTEDYFSYNSFLIFLNEKNI